MASVIWKLHFFQIKIKWQFSPSLENPLKQWKRVKAQYKTLRAKYSSSSLRYWFRDMHCFSCKTDPIPPLIGCLCRLYSLCLTVISWCSSGCLFFLQTWYSGLWAIAAQVNTPNGLPPGLLLFLSGVIHPLEPLFRVSGLCWLCPATNSPRNTTAMQTSHKKNTDATH